MGLAVWGFRQAFNAAFDLEPKLALIKRIIKPTLHQTELLLAVSRAIIQRKRVLISINLVRTPASTQITVTLIQAARAAPTPGSRDAHRLRSWELTNRNSTWISKLLTTEFGSSIRKKNADSFQAPQGEKLL